MNTPDPTTAARALRARNLALLGALAALFLLPLAAAFFTYYATSWRPAGSVSHGVLITPVRTLPPGLPQLPQGTRRTAARPPLQRPPCAAIGRSSMSAMAPVIQSASRR